MNAIIANILKEKLSGIDNGVDDQGADIEKGLRFVDKYAGLVQVGEKVQPTEIEGAFSVSKFPISVDVDYEECFNSGCYKDMVPNSSQRGILYFEDLGLVPLNNDRGFYQYQSKLRLICWVNNKLVQGNNCNSISHLYTNKIRQALEIGYFNENNISNIRVTANNIIGNEYRLFEKYTYPKEIIKYLMHPYEAFGIDYNITFRVSQSCLPEIEINPELC